MRALWEGTLASPGFIFFYGIGIDTPTQGWAHKCLNSWQVKGLCLLGIMLPHCLYSEADEPPFSLHDRVKRSMLAGYQDIWWQSLLGILSPRAGIYVNRGTLRNHQAPLVIQPKRLQAALQPNRHS